MAIFIWFYLAIMAAYFFIQSIIHQKKIREREEKIFAMFEIQENRIQSDYEILKRELLEIEN